MGGDSNHEMWGTCEVCGAEVDLRVHVCDKKGKLPLALVPDCIVKSIGTTKKR
jgi:hypothetical protein